jgi:hypothetical protein
MRWIPQWHPVVWAIVIIVIIAVVQNPVGMGHRAGSLIHGIGYMAHQVTIAVENVLP